MTYVVDGELFKEKKIDVEVPADYDALHIKAVIAKKLGTKISLTDFDDETLEEECKKEIADKRKAAKGLDKFT